MRSKSVTINNRKIGRNHPPYIIAEMSGNHNGNIERAKKLINVAHESGADAIKFQTYRADSLTIKTSNKDFVLKDGAWSGQNIYNLYEHASTPWEWFPELFKYAKSVGITAFSSPFDLEAVKFLETLETPAYKIASNELIDWPLIEAVVKTKKPILLSTGTATKDELRQTLKFISGYNLKTEIIILHCVSSYPANYSEMNLKTIIDINNSFPHLYGLSDHSLGTASSIIAVGLGASVIEKHLTIDRQDGAPDSTFSMEPKELKRLCSETKSAWQSIGKIKYGGTTQLEKKGIFTRQIWSIEKIKEGDIFDWKNLKSIRAPLKSNGISPDYKAIIGKEAKDDIAPFTPITTKMIKK